MKKISVIVLCLVCNIAFAQNKSLNLVTSGSNSTQVKPQKVISSNGLSPQAAFLLMELVDLGRVLTPSDTAIIKNYGIVRSNGSLFVNAFAILSEETTPESLIRQGVNIRMIDSTLARVMIPVENFVSIAQSGVFKYLDTGSKAKPVMDAAKQATGVDRIHNADSLTTGYFGGGVVVGIIDIGFDYTHPNFYDSTMANYRIKRVWEQEATSGTSPQPYNYGRELTTQTEILAAQRSEIYESHGTHVAGIAAGGGTDEASLKKYKGVASESDIVVVATNMYDGGIFDGIQYIHDYANSVGKPCVINMSIGGHIGPHDGTSVFDRVCDALTTQDSTGFLLIGAAGNEASDMIHVSKTINNDTLQTFVKFEGGITGAGYGRIDIWGEENTNLTVEIYLYDTAANCSVAEPVVVSSSDGQTTQHSLTDASASSQTTALVTATGVVNTTNQKPNVSLRIDNTTQSEAENQILLRITSSANGSLVHAWSFGDASFFSNGYSSCQDGDKHFTVGEIGGTGNSMITVGAWVTKRSWTHILGYEFENPDNFLDSIAPFSSNGPTADGRMKPDITAPGAMICSSVNSFDPYYPEESAFVIDQYTNSANTWYFAAMQGTSMATPFVTGVMALLLEACPELTINQAKRVLAETATNHNYDPNAFGYGKINAYRALQTLLNAAPPKPVITPNDDIVICNNAFIELSAPEGYDKYLWSNGDTTRTIIVSHEGEYSVSVINGYGFASPYSDPVTVVDASSIEIVFSGDSIICPGEQTTISTEGFATYLWSDWSSDNEITVRPSETTTYTLIATDSNNCVYVSSVKVVVLPNASKTINASICEGSSYTANGFDENSSGTYSLNLQASNGCDSTVTLNLTVNPNYETSLSETVNQGSDYTGNGFNLTNVQESGTYTQTLTATNGCDSVIVLNLTVNVGLEGTNNSTALSASLYPNPAEDFVTLKLENLTTDAELTVFNLEGRAVLQRELQAGEREVKLDLGNLAAGTYNIRITSREDITTHKLIKH